MSNDAPNYNIAAIRQLLLSAFTAEDLRRFCHDRPEFRVVVRRFSPRHSLEDMADELITYCENFLLFPELLAELKQHNPRQYARHEPDLTLPTPARKVIVFFASPDEVRSVRKAALNAIERMAHGEIAKQGVRLILCDQDSVPPSAVNREGGEVAEDAILKHELFGSCDLLVLILWRRLGSQTGKAESGTVQEFNQAYDRFQRTGKPEIYPYFQKIDPLCLDEPCSNLDRLVAFQKRLKEEFYLHTFETERELQARLRDHLWSYLREQRLVCRRSRAADWHEFSGYDETPATEEMYPYYGRQSLRDQLDRLEFQFLQLRKEIAPDFTTHKFDLYKYYRTAGDYETALIYLKEALRELLAYGDG